jgi:hypothetical protein
MLIDDARILIRSVIALAAAGLFLIVIGVVAAGGKGALGAFLAKVLAMMLVVAVFRDTRWHWSSSALMWLSRAVAGRFSIQTDLHDLGPARHQTDGARIGLRDEGHGILLAAFARPKLVPRGVQNLDELGSCRS